jgi:hypothetical protein
MLIHYSLNIDVISDVDVMTPTYNEMMTLLEGCVGAHKGGHTKRFLSNEQAVELLREWGWTTGQIEMAGVFDAENDS